MDDGVHPSPRPTEPGIHLSVRLDGTRLDYVACETAAREFVRDWDGQHCIDAVELVDTAYADTHMRGYRVCRTSGCTRPLTEKGGMNQAHKVRSASHKARERDGRPGFGRLAPPAARSRASPACP